MKKIFLVAVIAGTLQASFYEDYINFSLNYAVKTIEYADYRNKVYDKQQQEKLDAEKKAKEDAEKKAKEALAKLNHLANPKNSIDSKNSISSVDSENSIRVASNAVYMASPKISKTASGLQSVLKKLLKEKNTRSDVFPIVMIIEKTYSIEASTMNYTQMTKYRERLSETIGELNYSGQWLIKYIGNNTDTISVRM